jgi:hypothetical protein
MTPTQSGYGFRVRHGEVLRKCMVSFERKWDWICTRVGTWLMERNFFFFFFFFFFFLLLLLLLLLSQMQTPRTQFFIA